MHDRLLAIACAEIGVVEVGTSNTGKRVREYQAATSTGGTGWYWCAAYTAWCIREWLKDPEVVRWLGLKTTTPALWRPKSARAFAWRDWALARPRTCLVLPEKAIVEPGDIMVFDASHIAFATRDRGTRVDTVEGNTSRPSDFPGPMSRERDGGGVWPKQRRKVDAREFIRIRPST